MESEDMEKRENRSFTIILAIFIVLICVWGWLLGSKALKKKDGKENVKIDSSLDYVYDAKYLSENKHTQYSDDEKNQTSNLNEFGLSIEYIQTGKHDLKELKVPYINLNSDDAKKANSHLKEIYLEYADAFDKIAEAAANSDAKVGNLMLSYLTYSYKDILSIVVVYGESETAPFEFQYITYNFDLETGKFLTYAEALSKLGYDQANTTTKAKDLLKAKMDSLYSDIDLANGCSNVDEKMSCYEIANAMFENSVKNGDVLFFVNNDGVLNFLLIPYYDGVQNGDSYRYVFPINK